MNCFCQVHNKKHMWHISLPRYDFLLTSYSCGQYDVRDGCYMKFYGTLALYCSFHHENKCIQIGMGSQGHPIANYDY